MRIKSTGTTLEYVAKLEAALKQIGRQHPDISISDFSNIVKPIWQDHGFSNRTEKVLMLEGILKLAKMRARQGGVVNVDKMIDALRQWSTEYHSDKEGYLNRKLAMG